MEITRRHISRSPHVQECLRGGMINYSKLARIIASEHKIANLGAVVVACRRVAAGLKPKGTAQSILKNSRKSIDIRGSKARIKIDVEIKKEDLADALDILGV